MNTLLDPPEARPMQHRMSPLHSEASSFDDSHNLGSQGSTPQEPPTRELTLGTATILGLFFALALVCAVFFGFGYSLGTRHTTATLAVASTTAPSTIAVTAKPAPGSPLATTIHAAPEPPNETVTVPVAPTPVRTLPAPANSSEASPRPAELPADPHPVLASAAQPIVQVAAVSHQEDAELIASTLKRRGYPVVIRSEPQDKLLHLQLGPFPTKKDAEAMRQRLLADGFNAYIK